jgi:hypothetical protein
MRRGSESRGERARCPSPSSSYAPQLARLWRRQQKHNQFEPHRVQKRKKKLVGFCRRKRDEETPRKGKMGKDEENYDESEIIYGGGERWAQPREQRIKKKSNSIWKSEEFKWGTRRRHHCR